jgi:hypothetical protein
VRRTVCDARRERAIDLTACARQPQERSRPA